MHAICEQWGDTDAHALLTAASQYLGRTQKSTGRRWTRRSLKNLQEELGWERWMRVTNAVQDLEDITGGEIYAEDGHLQIGQGFECGCETSASSSLLDTASSRATRVPARGDPSPPSPISPSSSPSASDSGRWSSSGRAASRRIEDGSDRSSQDEAPHQVAGRRIGRRQRGATEQEQIDRDQREREKLLRRRGTPVEQWNAADLAEEFRHIAVMTFDSFAKQRNPIKPLAKFFSDARASGVDNAILLTVVQEYLRDYDLDGPPWRPFISIAPELIEQRQTRVRAFGTSRERVRGEEIRARYGSRRRSTSSEPMDD